jgi:hypothetical protein
MAWEYISEIVGETNSVSAICEFKGNLYAGSMLHGEIYRTSDGISWNEVYKSDQDVVWDLYVYNNYLYASYQNNGVVVRTIDGITWEQVMDLAIRLFRFCEFNNHLYIGEGSSGLLARSETGATGTWSTCHDFTEGKAKALEVFNNELWASLDSKIYKSANGTDWVLQDSTIPNDGSLYADLKTFKGYLYLLNGIGEIYRSNGAGWIKVRAGLVSESSYELAIFDDELYATIGTTNDTDGIYKTNNGTVWVKDFSLITEPKGMGTFGYQLYVGVKNILSTKFYYIYIDPPEEVEVMRSARAKKNMVAVSANTMETGINVDQVTDTAIMVAVTDMADITHRRENNVDELTGKEEADVIYALGGTSAMAWTFKRAQPQHFAILYAYGFGNIVSSDLVGGGRLHTIKPIDGDLQLLRSNPTMTLVFREGDVIDYAKYTSMAVESVTSTFRKDDWVSVNGSLVGTGKHELLSYQETVVDAEDTTELTVVDGTINGSDSASRADNIHQVRMQESTGEWSEIGVTGSSSDTTIQIIAGGAGIEDRTFKIIYLRGGQTWTAERDMVYESPLRVSEVEVNLGGKWNGTEFVGGKTISNQISDITHTVTNGFAVEFLPGAGGNFASRIFRPARTQTLTLNRELRDAIIKHYANTVEYFGVKIVATGAAISATENYSVTLIFPRCGILDNKVSVDGQRINEAGDLSVLEDATYGSAIVLVQNEIATYAA